MKTVLSKAFAFTIFAAALSVQPLSASAGGNGCCDGGSCPASPSEFI